MLCPRYPVQVWRNSVRSVFTFVAVLFEYSEPFCLFSVSATAIEPGCLPCNNGRAPAPRRPEAPPPLARLPTHPGPLSWTAVLMLLVMTFNIGIIISSECPAFSPGHWGAGATRRPPSHACLALPAARPCRLEA